MLLCGLYFFPRRLFPCCILFAVYRTGAGRMQVNLRIAGRYLGGSTKITQFSGSMRENRADVPGKNRLAQRNKIGKQGINYQKARKESPR